MPGHEVSVPSQQGLWLDEEVSETLAGEQSCEPRQHCSIRRLQRRSMDLAPKNCDFVSEHEDLDGEVNVSAAYESDQLKEATERPEEEGEGPRRMVAASRPGRQSAGRRLWMAFSTPTGLEEVESGRMGYIDWFNQRRLHGEITDDSSYVTPAEFEAAYYWQTAPAIEAVTE